MLSGLAAVPIVLSAHHSGLYDETDVVAIEGTLIAIDWVNPHVRLTLEVADTGDDTRWEVEGASANVLARWGVERNRFATGDRLRVTGPASRFGADAMIGALLERPDGERVLFQPSVASRLGLAETGVDGLFPPPQTDASAAPRPSRGIFGVWTPRGRTPAMAPADLPLTERARAAAAQYSPLEDDPALRCELPGMPAMLDTWYPVELVDAGNRIVIRYEEFDGVRTVYMPPNRPPVEAHSPNGVSFGRWEGDTLAVFTLYIDYPYYDRLGTPQSESVTVLERYTPSADGTRLDWQATVTDPATFTEPVTRSGHMAFAPGEEIKPYDCTRP